MNNEQDRQKELVNTTDCLEAINVFKFWKNILFILILICLLLLQVCFWVINLGLVSKTQVDEVGVAEVITEESSPDVSSEVVEKTQKKIEAAAKKVTGDVNEPAIAERPQKKSINFTVLFKQVHFMWIIKTVDFLLILLSLAYCLLILFTLKISMVGRLGGINHISRALVLSVLFLVCLLPWQEIFGWFTAGALYAPGELLTYLENSDPDTLTDDVFLYLRFVGYWFVVLLFVIFAQIRTCRWSKATLRRLEVV